MIRNEDKGPEVAIFFDPGVASLGVCSFSFSWSNVDEEKAWKNADETLEKLTEETIFAAVDKAIADLKGAFEPPEGQNYQ